MLVFPQLSKGSASMYPAMRKNVTRTVVNALADGSFVVFADPDAGLREWELRLSGLNPDEWTAIDALFQAVSGRLGAFTFLDPAGNLLARSEEFGASEWDNGPLIALTAGLADPVGTTRATGAINTGSVAAAVQQTVALPGNFRYVLSVWAKTTGGSGIALFATTTGGSVTQDFVLSTQWRRISLAIELGVNTESVTFGAQLNAGATVDLFGMQVEAQLGMSDYKKTGASGGVHADARFVEDELMVRAQGIEVFDAVVRIVAS